MRTFDPKRRGNLRRGWLRRGARGVLYSALTILMASNAFSEAPAEAEPKAEESACPAGTGEATAALIQARYDGIRDIHAKFEQTSESASFAGQPMMTAEAKTGWVVFAKPGKMKWSYVSPEPSVVVSDGEVLWIYDVAGKSATRLEVTAGFLSGAALQFLLGDGQLLESFEIDATVCGTDQITLDLTPRAEATYERLGLVAQRETGDILGTSMLDLFGNLTEIRFHEIEINRDPGDETFEFDVPDGVEVIDYAGSPIR